MNDLLRALTTDPAGTGRLPVTLLANAAGALTVVGGSAPTALIDNLSGTIAVGGTSQQVSAPEPERSMLLIQNPSTETEPLYYDFGRAATIDDNSPELAPGQAALLDIAIPNTSITVNATTAGHRFFIRQGRLDPV